MGNLRFPRSKKRALGLGFKLKEGLKKADVTEHRLASATLKPVDCATAKPGTVCFRGTVMGQKVVGFCENNTCRLYKQD